MIEVEHLGKIHTGPAGKTITVLDDVSMRVEAGEFVSLLGPSGCGKTTLLNLIAGFERPDRGVIRINRETVTEPSPRRITIFQNYGLLPWRTVRRNVELGLERHGLGRREREEQADRYLRMVGLSEFANHHPNQLSGGMQQRVAIARALAVKPEVIFMDEPFSALDPTTRAAIQQELAEIRKQQQMTVLFVTHDIDEAIYLSDRIIVLSPRPGVIRAEHRVALPYPRNRRALNFQALRDAVLSGFEPWQKSSEYHI